MGNFLKKTKKYTVFKCIVTTLITAALLLQQYSFVYAAVDELDKEQVKNEIERIYNERSKALVNGDSSTLKELFDTSQKYGQWALEHETKRVKYIRNWSAERNMKFTDINSTIRVKKIYPGTKVTKVALEETYKFDYVYNNDPNNQINSFGVGIRHTVSIMKKDDKWVIYNDWYTDCFEDALQAYTAASISTFPKRLVLNTKDGLQNAKAVSTYKRSYYDREKAVAYADKYCGAAWGSGNDFKYNNRYIDFNGIGGDCTNFASQVLGDKEGGGLPQDGTWRCPLQKGARAQGSRAWVNADGLRDYLVYSGKGSVISRGTFKELTKPIEGFPQGVVGKLHLGDLVCYEKGLGNIDHFAVVTGFDSQGYPLVNSHTTDRYHVPWDLGWGDKKIRFFLIHING